MRNSLVWQRTTYLAAIGTESYDMVVDPAVGIIQHEALWLKTFRHRSVVLAVYNYSTLVKSALYIEGTDSPAGGWVTVWSFTEARTEDTPFLLELSSTRQRANGRGRLWGLLRWRWGPNMEHTTPEIDGESACFKIQAVMKP